MRRRWMIDGPQSTVAVDVTWQLQTRGSGTKGGGMVGEIEGYLWMRRWAADATREEVAAAVRGAMGKQKWCVVCPLTYFVRRS